MCTSGSADILIVATHLGSMLLYDLKNTVESNPNLIKTLNYMNLLQQSVKDWDTLDENKKQAYMNKCIVNF